MVPLTLFFNYLIHQVDVYNCSKRDYVASSQRVENLRKEFNLLEKELTQYYNYIHEVFCYFLQAPNNFVSSWSRVYNCIQIFYKHVLFYLEIHLFYVIAKWKS